MHKVVTVSTIVVLLTPFFLPSSGRCEQSADSLIAKAKYYFRNEEFDKGFKLLKLADIVAESNYEKDVPPRMLRTLKPSDLDFGEEQVRQMLSDRPAMAKGINSDDKIYNWAVHQFAGESAVNRVRWSNETPTIFPSTNHPPTRMAFGEIRIASLKKHCNNQEQTFEELWACAVYELCSLGFCMHYSEIDARAFEGRITKEEYVRQNFRLEFFAAICTRRQFVDTVSDELIVQRLGATPELWYFHQAFLSDWKTAFSQYTDRNEYPWREFGEAFDRITAGR